LLLENKSVQYSGYNAIALFNKMRTEKRLRQGELELE